MRCSRFRKIIVWTTRGERSSRLEQQLDEHQQQCSACREYGRRMEVVEVLLREMPAEKAPAAFSERVRQRVRQLEVPQPLPWYRKLFHRELRSPVPIIQPAMGLAAVAAILVVISVGGLFLRSSGRAGAPMPSATTTVATSAEGGTMLAEAAGQPADSLWEEVSLRHRQYVRNHPLGDDPGLQLISYTE